VLFVPVCLILKAAVLCAEMYPAAPAAAAFAGLIVQDADAGQALANVAVHAVGVPVPACRGNGRPAPINQIARAAVRDRNSNRFVVIC
jgi:hypothetical protein